jgi:hypothetical protein
MLKRMREAKLPLESSGLPHFHFILCILSYCLSVIQKAIIILWHKVVKNKNHQSLYVKYFDRLSLLTERKKLVFPWFTSF